MQIEFLARQRDRVRIQVGKVGRRLQLDLAVVCGHGWRGIEEELLTGGFDSRVEGGLGGPRKRCHRLDFGTFARAVDHVSFFNSLILASKHI